MVKIIENKGDSYETAIKITDANEDTGVDAEYYCLFKRFGRRNEKWKLMSQTLMVENGRYYDVMDIQMIESGEKVVVYFDIQDFYGVF
jgi:hypothetical protein